MGLQYLFSGANNNGRFSHFPLTGSVLPVLLTDIFYIAFVTRLGPAFMKNRAPYNLKPILAVYNVTQILVNLYIVLVGLTILVLSPGLQLDCLLPMADNDPLRDLEVQVGYTYYLLKYFDYLETVFFILRKSYRQVSFLHVYHHLMLTTVVYGYIKYYGFGGHATVTGCANAVVHLIMYTYYLLSLYRNDLNAFGWKKLVTRLQITQFILIILHQVYPLLFKPACTYPRSYLLLGIFQAVVLLYLFGKFYIDTYMNKTTEKTDEKRLS